MQKYLKAEEDGHELMGWELRVWTEWHGLHWPVGSESLWERNSPLGWAFLGISGKWSKEIQPAFFVFSRAAPTAYRGSKARGLIGAVAAGLHHIHSNVGSALSLQPTTTAHGNVIALTHWARPGTFIRTSTTSCAYSIPITRKGPRKGK